MSLPPAFQRIPLEVRISDFGELQMAIFPPLDEQPTSVLIRIRRADEAPGAATSFFSPSDTIVGGWTVEQLTGLLVQSTARPALLGEASDHDDAVWVYRGTVFITSARDTALGLSPAAWRDVVAAQLIDHPVTEHPGAAEAVVRLAEQLPEMAAQLDPRSVDKDVPLPAPPRPRTTARPSPPPAPVEPAAGAPGLTVDLFAQAAEAADPDMSAWAPDQLRPTARVRFPDPGEVRLEHDGVDWLFEVNHRDVNPYATVLGREEDWNRIRPGNPLLAEVLERQADEPMVLGTVDDEEQLTLVIYRGSLLLGQPMFLPRHEWPTEGQRLVVEAARQPDPPPDENAMAAMANLRATLGESISQQQTREQRALERQLAKEIQQAEEQAHQAQLRAERRGRSHIPERVRREVWRRDEARCVECGSQDRLEYDHIIPWSKGGSDTARNLRLLCEDCNRRKSDDI